MDETIRTELIASVVLVVVPYFLTRFFAWWKKRAEDRKDAAYLEAVAALEVGVHEAWVEAGKAYKAASGTGKFTGDQKANLRDLAETRATEVASEKGVDLVKTLGRRAIPWLIKRIVDRRKAKK